MFAHNYSACPNAGAFTADADGMFGYHLSQLERCHAEATHGQMHQIATLQRENTQLNEELSRLRASRAGHTQPQTAEAPEPYAADTRTGALWARLAQAVWTTQEAQFKVKAANIQQERRHDATGISQSQQALETISAPHGASGAAQAYDFVYGRRTPSLLWKAAAVALRNNFMLRLCCRIGTCRFPAVKAEMEQIYGPGRVGAQGFDLDLRSQMLNSYEHAFPGYRCSNKRKRNRVRRTGSPAGSDEVPQPDDLQQEWHVVPEQSDDEPPIVIAESEERVAKKEGPVPRWQNQDWQSQVTLRNTFLHVSTRNLEDSEDERSQKGSCKSCPAMPSTVISAVGNAAFLEKLRAEMPTVAEECHTHMDVLLTSARNSANDGNMEKLQRILECLMLLGEDPLPAMRQLLAEFESEPKALVQCCMALGQFGGGSGRTLRNEIVALLLAQLGRDPLQDEGLLSACLDGILHIVRDVKEVLGLPGARVPERGFSKEVRAQIDRTVGPLAKRDGTPGTTAVQILARTLPLDRVLQAIDQNGWSIPKALSEIFYTLERAIQCSSGENTPPSEKQWACKLLNDVAQQRQQEISNNLFLLAWLRDGKLNHSRRTDRCIMLGSLFQSSVLINIFNTAVEAFDEDLMSLVSSALQGINDNLVSLPKEECDRLALLALKVDQNGVRPWCRTSLMSMLGSIMKNRSDALFTQVLKAIVAYAQKFMHGWQQNSTVDYTVMWSLCGFAEKSSSWMDHKDEIFKVCESYIEKYQGNKNEEAMKVMDLATQFMGKDTA